MDLHGRVALPRSPPPHPPFRERKGLEKNSFPFLPPITSHSSSLRQGELNETILSFPSLGDEQVMFSMAFSFFSTIFPLLFSGRGTKHRASLPPPSLRRKCESLLSQDSIFPGVEREAGNQRPSLFLLFRAWSAASCLLPRRNIWIPPFSFTGKGERKGMRKVHPLLSAG